MGSRSYSSSPERRRHHKKEKRSSRDRSKERYSRKRSRSRSRDRKREKRSRSREDRHHKRGNEHRRRHKDSDQDQLHRHSRDEIKRERDSIKSEPTDEGNLASTSGNPVPEEKQGPNFETSGKLLEDTNVYNGVVIKYSEPPEAKKPKKRWRLYVFKGDESLPVLHMHRQSAFLLGKDRKVADIPIDHPSCSRQHAVFQYRMINKNGAKKVLPYIIDLGSSNGTFLNNDKIDAQRYYELKEKDVLKFGFSSREYVLLHDQSVAADDD